MVAVASQTSTEHPARASVIAAARPFGPEPTITASYSIGMLKLVEPIMRSNWTGVGLILKRAEMR
jgi:hypothetical protein